MQPRVNVGRTRRYQVLVLSLVVVGATLALSPRRARTAEGEGEAQVDALEAARAADAALAAGEHRRAAGLYEDALEAGLSTKAIHFNLGLAYAHLEDFGLSTFHLTQAHFMAPRATDIGDSLALVRAEAQRRRAEAAQSDEVTKGEPAAVFWLDFFLRLERSEVELAIIVASWLAFGLLLLLRRMSKSALRDAAAVAAILSLVVLVLSAAYAVGGSIVRDSVRPGVVVVEQPLVRQGPDRHAPRAIEAELSIGSVVLIREERGPWVQVELAEERVGWLPDSALRRIRVD